MGWFLFKSQSQVRGTERTPGDGAFSQRRDGGGGLEEILPYAGRARWSQGQLPPGRSRVSAGPCPAWSSLLPSLPAFCVSAPTSSVPAPLGAAASGLSSACRGRIQVQHWTAPRSGHPLHDRWVSAPGTATPSLWHPPAPLLSALSLLSYDSRTQDFCLVSGLCVSHSATSLRRRQGHGCVLRALRSRELTVPAFQWTECPCHST